MKLPILLLAILTAHIFPAGLTASAAAAEIDFNRDIRPILSDRCFACHGPDKEANDSGLRLDAAEFATAELPSGFGRAIVPGDPAGSELMQRILTDDKSLVMPPPDSHLTLSKAEKETLRQWIAQGAPYAAHWAFVTPKKAPLPEVPPDIQAVNAIDRFVFAHLAAQGLRPAPAADRYTLIRRLSLDLTGLPPSADEVTAFVNDDSPGAYEKLVDRLLGSPHFGERLAIDWLDAARYADTNGFSIDGGRHIWLWRDWVINAFNTNKPYDQFLVEQIAGDQLPNPTPAQLIASGFQRNNMVTHEGGTIPEENLTNYNADRVKTLGEAVLGLTLACAQCHDHKYDPITQEDYYSLFAYFNTLGDIGLDGNAGVNPRPYLTAKTVLETGEVPALRKRIAELKSALESPDHETFAVWEANERRLLETRGKDLALSPIKVLKVSTPNRGAGWEVDDEKTIRITGPNGLAAYDILTQLPPSKQPITGLRIVFHPDSSVPGNGWGHGPQPRARGKQPVETPDKGTFRLTACSVSTGEVGSDQVDLYRLLDVASVTANAWDPEHRPENCLDMRNENGWSPSLAHDGPVHLTLTFKEPIDPAETPYLTTQLNFGAGDNLIAARMELFALHGTDDGSARSPEAIAALQTPADKRTPELVELLHQEYAACALETERLRIDLANAEERLAVLTQEFPTMVMNIAEKPRQTFILNRGNYAQPTVPVSMSTPDWLPQSKEPQENRLALARWVTMPNHPLTSRVYVNRIWQLLFGEGLVRTPADFGAQGEWPTHPELLDWLAVDFVESGWDIKALVKQIVMSATYRHSAVASPELLQQDPQNRLLARGPRYRLPAELIRDSALKVSGLLNPQLGGPSVNPYTPGDLWREISHYGSTPATAQTFVQDHGDKLYRRSLYTYWKRTAPPPNMAAFDAPNRETCVVSRPTTNTPLQALVLLNDVQFVEASRTFAERISHQDGDARSRIEWAFLEALSRPAEPQEIDIVLRALERERTRYREQPAAARQLVSHGESPVDGSLPTAELAAWTQIASLILNLSETVTRN